MSNRLDKLFRDAVLKHHLPNAGPDWAALEANMHGKKKKPYVMIGAFIAICCVVLTTLLVMSTSNSGQIPTAGQTAPSENGTPNEPNNTTYPSAQNNIISTPNFSTNQSSNASPKALKAKYKSTVVSQSSSTTPVPEIKVEVNGNNLTNTKSVVNNSNETEVSVTKDNTENIATDNIQSTSAKTEPSQGNASTTISSTPKLPVKQGIKTKKLLSIGLNFNPAVLISRNNLNSDSSQSNIHKSFVGLKNGGEKMKDALGFDFSIRYSPFKKFAVGTGFLYEVRQEEVNYNFIRNEIPVIDSASGEIITYFHVSDTSAEKINVKSTNTYSYAGIPLYLNFKLLQTNKFGIGIHANSSFMKQTSLKGNTINETTLKQESLTTLNSLQVSRIFNAGFGVDLSFNLVNNLSLNIAANFNSQLNKSRNTTKAKQTGLNIGLQYFIF